MVNNFTYLTFCLANTFTIFFKDNKTGLNKDVIYNTFGFYAFGSSLIGDINSKDNNETGSREITSVQVFNNMYTELNTFLSNYPYPEYTITQISITNQYETLGISLAPGENLNTSKPRILDNIVTSQDNDYYYSTQANGSIRTYPIPTTSETSSATSLDLNLGSTLNAAREALLTTQNEYFLQIGLTRDYKGAVCTSVNSYTLWANKKNT